MFRLSLCYVFLVLFGLTQAQGGYEYNRPDRPFSGTGGSGGPGQGYPGGSQPQGSGGPGARPGQDAGSPSSPSYPGSYPTGPQNDYQVGQLQGTSPSLPGSKFPQSNAGYPGSGNLQQQPQSNGKPSYLQAPGSSFPTRPVHGQGYQSQPGPTGPGYAPGSNALSERYPQGASRPSIPGNNYPDGSSNKYPQGVHAGPGNQFGPQSDTGEYEGGDYSAIPGEPDIDYPIYTEIPQTSFSCDAQNYPGYYADVETRCQVFHVCHNNRTYDFLCPNGTIFNQEVFVCVWWNQFDCNSSPGLYDLNANLYDYSIKGSDSVSRFPPQSDFPDQGHSYPGNQGPSVNYPVSQGPTVNYPGSQGPQGPSASFPGSQGPSVNYPGNKGPQGPTAGYPGAPGPTSTYPGSQGPSSNFPLSQAPSKFPGSQRPQGPTSGYPGNQGYPGSDGQSPSQVSDSPVSSGPSSYPGSKGSSSYPGSSRPSSFPGSQGPTSFPGGQRPGFPGSNQGYPSGKPNGPSFPSGASTTRPGLPQSDTGFPNPQQPNREYLPPRN